MLRGGFIGTFLRIHLSNGTIVREPLDDGLARLFLGGNGYPVPLFFNEMDAGVDPLGSANKLAIFAGPVTGTIMPGSDSWVASFKSPLTGCWAESRCGGKFGPELKRSGFDGLILEGASDELVYILIRDGEVVLRSAEDLKGKSVPETEEILKDREGKDSKIVSIGPAGENLVRFAAVMSDGRAAGRCGAGAVFGAKGVKAIVARGTGNVRVADFNTYYDICRNIRIAQKELPICGTNEGAFGAGTMSWLPYYNQKGVIPVKYGRSNCWEGQGEAFYSELRNSYVVANKACEACTMACMQFCKVEKGEWETPLTDGPEYETVATFGHLMMNNRLEPIIHANYLCDSLGMDTISSGAVIAFGMECFERGWLNRADLEGLELTWGNMEAAITLLKKIAYREGCGDLFADGSRCLAEKIGGEAPETVLHVKGLDIPAHDPRGIYAGKSWLIQYATANRGACHIHPQEPSVLTGKYERLGFQKEDWPGIEDPTTLYGKAAIVKWIQDFGDVQEALGTCKFHGFASPAFTVDRYAELLSSATGWDVDSEELLNIGQRIFNAQRCFNVREGITREDDKIPGRFMMRPEFGPFKDEEYTATAKSDLDTAMKSYYSLRGWDPGTGIPTAEQLRELCLTDMIEPMREAFKKFKNTHMNHGS